MLPIANKPLIQYAFEEARDAGIEEFIFITGRNKNAINNHFDHAYELQTFLGDRNKEDALTATRGWLPQAGSIAFVRQQEPLGLGHAVWCARNFIGDEPFVVILADEMMLSKRGNFLKDMIDLYDRHSQNNPNVIAVADVRREDTKKYGIVCVKDDDGSVIRIEDMVEKPAPEAAPSNISITGRYILQPQIIEFLQKGEKGAGGEIQLTDAMKAMMHSSSSPFYGLRFTEQRFDCGNVLGYLEANIAYALENRDISADVKNMLKKYI